MQLSFFQSYLTSFTTFPSTFTLDYIFHFTIKPHGSIVQNKTVNASSKEMNERKIYSHFARGVFDFSVQQVAWNEAKQCDIQVVKLPISSEHVTILVFWGFINACQDIPIYPETSKIWWTIFTRGDLQTNVIEQLYFFMLRKLFTSSRLSSLS